MATARFCRSIMMLLCLLAALSIDRPTVPTAAAETPDAAGLDPLFALAGSALVETRDQRWEQAAEDLRRMRELWPRIPAADAPSYKEVGDALLTAERELARRRPDPDRAYEAVSRLSKALAAFERDSRGGREETSARADASALLPLLDRLAQAAADGNWAQAKLIYSELSARWSRLEPAVRSEDAARYGQIELHLSLLRVAIQADPPKPGQAKSESAALARELSSYRQGAGVSASAGRAAPVSVRDLLPILHAVRDDIARADAGGAGKDMNAFLQAWPNAEGAVNLQSASAYASIERQMIDLSVRLQAVPPDWNNAGALAAKMIAELEPLAQTARYTAWDAGIVLLREGLEALLVLAALLAVLRRTGNAGKAAWVWSGVALGLAASALLAVVLTYALNRSTAGSAREWLEGAAGLASALLMLSVGAWLHGKSNLPAWNRFVKERVGRALAAGSLWTLFGLAFLAVFREGAETVIFYFGMALAISPGQMLLGVGAASALLALIGFAIIRFSLRLPVRAFFLTASFLIYYLVFKFTGESLHSLQVAAVLPAHPLPALALPEGLGLYPTRETLLAQLAVLLLVAFRIAHVERKRRRERLANPAAAKQA